MCHRDTSFGWGGYSGTNGLEAEKFFLNTIVTLPSYFILFILRFVV